MISRASQFFAAVAWIVVTACAIGQNSNNPPIQDLATFPRSTLEIQTKPHSQKFKVWVADTPARQSQGLMFVRELPPDEGMIFINEQPRLAAFWMKNTYISLDLLFVTPDKRIAKIAANAPPLSLDTISSGVPISMVIELKAGESARRGVKVGDSVLWAGSAK